MFMHMLVNCIDPRVGRTVLGVLCKYHFWIRERCIVLTVYPAAETSHRMKADAELFRVLVGDVLDGACVVLAKVTSDLTVRWRLDDERLRALVSQVSAASTNGASDAARNGPRFIQRPSSSDKMARKVCPLLDSWAAL